MKIKRILSAAVVLAVMLCGCGSRAAGNESQAEQKTLREHGMDVIALMDEMVNSEDCKNWLFTGSSEINELVDMIAAGDYTEPETVYEISVPSMQDILNLLDEEDVSAVVDGLPDSLLEYFEHKAPSIIVNQMNAQSGSSAIAAASMYTANKLFVSNELEKDTVYLYVFQTGVPVVVVFTSGEDGAVGAVGTFILNENFSVETLEQMQFLFQDIFTIRELED